MPDTNDTFPRQYARTQRFTLGEPRDPVVSPDGHRVVFLRSGAGDDPVNALWVFDVVDGVERLVAMPAALLGDDQDEALPAEERARRERAREGAGGITSYATDDAVTVAAFTLAGRLFVAGLLSGKARELPVDGPVFDPRPDPCARRLAYVSGPNLRVGELDGSSRILVGPATGEESVSWGAAEFIAAEEMGRFRGYWWSPDGERLAICRVDEAATVEWTIADPAHPERPANVVHYPAAGTANAHVTLHIVDLAGTIVDVDWDIEFFPYLTDVRWNDQGLLLHVQSRDQRGTMSLRVDPDTGETTVLGHDYDDAWIELIPGSPQLLPDGRLVTAADREGLRRVLVDGTPVTPNDLQVRSIGTVGIGGEPVVRFQANHLDAPDELHTFELRVADLAGEPVQLTSGRAVHQVSGGVFTTVTRRTTLDAPGTATIVDTVLVPGRAPIILESFAEPPAVVPNITFHSNERMLVAVLLPHDRQPGDGGPLLPVLLDPYGGPHGLRVSATYNAYLTSQWFADQGFAVVVADGRGTPGRGSGWERAVHLDLATAPLDDQITALRVAAAGCDLLDLDRVAIRGWSFGGYLAALAVLRQPDVFHAAIAGAPVTDWTLYDTHYTERYLGDPTQHPEVYTLSSLLADAPMLRRPLLLIHGLADDNVVAAHTLRLSAALLAAGRPHEVLPLVGVSHMTPQEVVAENLLRHQLAFLRRVLGHGSIHA